MSKAVSLTWINGEDGYRFAETFRLSNMLLCKALVVPCGTKAPQRHPSLTERRR